MNKFSKLTSEKSSKKAPAKKATAEKQVAKRTYTKRAVKVVESERVAALEAQLKDLMDKMERSNKPAPVPELMMAITKLNQNLNTVKVEEAPAEVGWLDSIWGVMKQVAPYAAGTVIGVTAYHVASGNSPEPIQQPVLGRPRKF